MFQGDGVVLKGRLEIGLREVAGVARLGKKSKIRQFQVRDNTGNGIDHGKVSLSLPQGMGEHQADEQQADTRQDQGRG